MKYIVEMAKPVFMSITVEAKNEDEAIDKAYDLSGLESFVGNGGTDKLIGVTEECVSIIPGDVVLEGVSLFDINVTKDADT